MKPLISIALLSTLNPIFGYCDDSESTSDQPSTAVWYNRTAYSFIEDLLGEDALDCGHAIDAYKQEDVDNCLIKAFGEQKAFGWYPKKQNKSTEGYGISLTATPEVFLVNYSCDWRNPEDEASFLKGKCVGAKIVNKHIQCDEIQYEKITSKFIPKPLRRIVSIAPKKQ
ncbi:MAG: hypothetical protein COA42_19415 [Alteromonadaceae bacterium]|nr:MAG: hypothetical protein COA42_19415 [Alteromonadaceae bacterium]